MATGGKWLRLALAFILFAGPGLLFNWKQPPVRLPAAVTFAKLNQSGRFASVFAGDSRTLSALDPDFFPGSSYNFAFPSLSLQPDYLARAGRLVGERGRLIIGVTPLLLSDYGAATGPYFEQTRVGSTGLLAARLLGSGLDLWTPVTRARLSCWQGWAHPRQLNWNPKPNGWAGYVPLHPSQQEQDETRAHYREIFTHHRYQEERLQTLCKFVADARSQSLSLICFWPPCADWMVAFEDQHSGMDRAHVKQSLHLLARL